MASIISRRIFVLGATSIGSAMMIDGIKVVAKARNDDARILPSANLANEQQNAERQAGPRVLVFDVNQTLLDLNALTPHFARVFGDAKALDDWFSLLLQYSLVVTVTNSYSDFGTVGGAVLDMLAANKKIRMSPEDRTRIMRGLLTLPAHPDVPESLKRLREAGFRMVTLTNSSPAAVKAQLENAGLTRYFEESISVESVHRFKPDLEVYRSAAAHLGVEPAGLRLIAAHAWDVFGAMKAGWHAAFVARKGITLLPLGPKPEIIGSDMSIVTDAILG